MDSRIQSIVNQEDTAALTQEDMVYVVQKYIKDRKKVIVRIEIIDEKHPIIRLYPRRDPILTQYIVTQLVQRLCNAYTVAKYYFKNKKEYKDGKCNI